MAMIKLIVLLLIISSIYVESRALRKRRQYSSSYSGQTGYPYSSSYYGAGTYNPSGSSYSGYPYNTYGTGSVYGAGLGQYGTGSQYGQYGTGGLYGQYGTGSQYGQYGTGGLYGQYGTGSQYGTGGLYGQYGTGSQYGQNPYNTYGSYGQNSQYPYYGSSGYGSSGYGSSAYNTGQYGGLYASSPYGSLGGQYGYNTQGNPWYRQGRKGDVQGRSGGASDDKAEGNPTGPNPSAPAAKSATGGSTRK